MKRLVFSFASFLLLIFSSFSDTSAQSLSDEREQLLQNLRKQQEAVNDEIDVYAEKAAANPENEGAKTLLRLLRAVADGIDLYMDNELVNDSLKQRSVRAWETSKRYNTESAQQTARVLSKVVELSSRVPRHFRPKTEATTAAKSTPGKETAAKEDDDDVPELNYGPDLANSKTPAKSAGSPNKAPDAAKQGSQGERPFALQENMFLLFGATVLILMGLGGLLLWRLRKQKAALLQQMADLQRRMENIDLVGENTGRASEMKQTQWQRKVEALESNMSDFLSQVDERVNQTQLIADKLSATSKKQIDQLEGLETKVNELLPLQDRLRLLEEKVKQMSAQSSKANGAATPKNGHTEQLNGTLPFLIQNLEALKSRTQQEGLRNRIEALLPSLQRAYKERSSASLDVDTLAKVIQLAYVSARNEGLQDNFENLKQATRKMGIRVEDQMDGRMSFSEFFAENLHLEEYLHGPELHSDVMPAPGKVREEVENSPQWQEGVKGTVLYTLLPAVVQQAEGAKRPLAKGTYIVQP